MIPAKNDAMREAILNVCCYVSTTLHVYRADNQSIHTNIHACIHTRQRTCLTAYNYTDRYHIVKDFTLPLNTTNLSNHSLPLMFTTSLSFTTHNTHSLTHLLCKASCLDWPTRQYVHHIQWSVSSRILQKQGGQLGLLGSLQSTMGCQRPYLNVGNLKRGTSHRVIRQAG
jgi:hypothetical protein